MRKLRIVDQATTLELGVVQAIRPLGHPVSRRVQGEVPGRGRFQFRPSLFHMSPADSERPHIACVRRLVEREKLNKAFHRCGP